MTFRLVMSKNDPRRTDFVLVGDHALRDDPAYAKSSGGPVYTANTVAYARPRNGVRATTTVTRTADTGDRLQVGLIEWPDHPNHSAQLVVGTRDVPMARSGIYTSPERFTAGDGYPYEWQIHDAHPRLVPLRTYGRPASYLATYVQSESGIWPRRKRSSSLFIPPEGLHILDDIVVTFIYFESKWRDKEGAKSRSSFPSLLM